MLSLKQYTSCAALLALTTGAYAQVSSINSANIQPRFFNDMPAATVNVNNSYPASITVTETGASKTTAGGLNRAAWFYSNNGGASAYQFQGGDYFSATFSVTLTGGTTGVDLEAGFLFKNPSGNFGGDLQSLVVGQGGNAGTVVQFGGPSYYPFSPGAGGYPGAGGSVPNYTLGATYTMGLIYTIDPVTLLNAFEYSVNGQFAASKAGDNYFDLGAGQFVGGLGDNMGGYFQIGNGGTNNPTNGGQGVFSNISITALHPVPEPTIFALLGLGILPILLRRRH